MTATTSATVIRMPLASALAPAPLAHGVTAEPCGSIPTISATPRATGFGVGAGTEGSQIGVVGKDRSGEATRSGSRDWRRYGQDRGQIEGGGPMRA